MPLPHRLSDSEKVTASIIPNIEIKSCAFEQNLYLRHYIIDKKNLFWLLTKLTLVISA